jgi:uncharacterized protein (DUF1778 family)
MMNSKATKLERAGRPLYNRAMVGKKKPTPSRKLFVTIRVTEDQHLLLTRAAERLTLGTSSWARSVLVAEARRILATTAK